LPIATHTEYQKELEKLLHEFKRDKILAYSHNAVRSTPVIAFNVFLFEFTVCIVVLVCGYIRRISITIPVTKTAKRKLFAYKFPFLKEVLLYTNQKTLVDSILI
jgi:hypothetical protein